MKDYFSNLIHKTTFNEADGSAAAIGILGVMEFLPEISAGLSAIWVALRIYIVIRDELFREEKKHGDE